METKLTENGTEEIATTLRQAIADGGNHRITVSSQSQAVLARTALEYMARTPADLERISIEVAG